MVLSLYITGNIKDISFIKMLCVVQLKEEICPNKNLQMLQFSSNIL